MAGKALDDEAGRALANQVRALFAADLDIQGVQIVLYNGQAKPAPLKTITLPAASETAPGVMSAVDKAKLDGVAAGANKTVVDSALSSASENPVQNKAVKAALDAKAASSHTHSASDVASGTLPVARGGTGASTKAAAVTALLGGLPNESAAISDGNAVAKYVSATGIPGYYTALQVWQYVKGKADPAYAAKSHAHSQYAPTASPSLTGTPKAPTAASGTSSTQIATTAFVQSAIDAKMAGAAMYKGAASKESDISATAYKAGWYWIVKTAGTFMGEACEAGDMVFANSDKGSAFSASHFDVVQANISYVTADDVKSWFA